MARGTPAPVDERVNAFQVEGRFLFRHYFRRDAVFARLREYYEPEQYRFAVPVREFDAVSRFLGEYDYALRQVPDPEPYTVVVRKYRSHPENVFGESVLQRSHGAHTLFVLRDERAVDRAVAEGATRLADAPLSVTFDAQTRLPTA